MQADNVYCVRVTWVQLLNVSFAAQQGFAVGAEPDSLLHSRYKRVFSVGTHAITTYNPNTLEVTNQVTSTSGLDF